MEFKKFLPEKGNGPQEYFWSLILEPGWVVAGIWRIFGKNAQVVAVGTPCAWELDEELLDTADAALSSTIQGFSEDLSEPSKTVFGVSSAWVSQGEMKQEYFEKIKKLCTELSLIPIGFVILPESIAHLVKNEEGSPLNAVVIGVYKENIEISVFSFGNLIGTTQVARSVSLVDDVIEGLSRFAGSNFPSRFIVYNGKEGELEEARQELLRVNWEDYDQLRLLHTPKIEIVDTKRKIEAVSLSGALEMSGIPTIKIKKTEEPGEKELFTPDYTLQAEKEEIENVAPASEVGFTMEKDIAKLATAAEESGESGEEKSQEAKPILSFSTRIRPLQKFLGKISEVAYLSFLSPLKLLLGKIAQKVFLLGLIILLGLFVSGFLFWWFYPKASVFIYISPKRLEEKIDIVVGPDIVFDPSQSRLPGEIKEAQVLGERTRETTGTRIVGEKAKGEVTLYRVGPEITLAAGTILHGPNGLDYVLEESVGIASGSAGSPGITKARVTAEDIGAQYNLASGTTFSVGNFSTSDIEAKNENPFEGGSSREISAVSQEDQEVLRRELQEELLEKAKQKIKDTVGGEKIFIEESLQTFPLEEAFSNKVGDEASTLKLSLSLKAKAVVVEKSQLVEIATASLGEKVPEGFTLRGEQMEFGFDLTRSKNDSYEFKVRVSANLLPKIDISKVKEDVKGRYIEVATKTLEREVPGFVRAEIRIRPMLPGRLKTLPHVAKNIEIELAAER